MNDKVKNTLIIILMSILIVLSLVIAFILGMKYDNKEANLIETKSEILIESYIEEKFGVPYIMLSGFDNENEEISNFYSSNNNNIDYVYHVSNNVLFFNIEKDYLVTPLEGSASYLNYYIDLKTNKLLSVQDVLNNFNVDMADFNAQCIGCNANSLSDYVRLMPVGNFIYVDPMIIGTFNSFVVHFTK